MDANLLFLFRVLWEERSSTAAARRLHVSQSAVSQSLRKMRKLFEDDLFVRIPGGLGPTPRAEQLAPEIIQVTSRIDSLMSIHKEFDPKTAEDTFQIGSTDYFERLFMPQIVGEVSKKAPHSRIRSMMLDGYLPKKALQSGEMDCAVAGYFQEIPSGYFQRHLFTDRLVGLCQQNHPFLSSEQNLQTYLDYPHLMVSITGDFYGKIDALLTQSQQRHITFTSPSFLTMPHILIHSESLLALPQRLANQMSKEYSLSTFELPVQSPTISIKMVWHERVHRDPFQKWMRALVAAASN